MSLNILVLTTETPHHVHFVRQLVEAGHHVGALREQQVFGTDDDVEGREATRQDYERYRWFGNNLPTLNDICPTYPAPSVNSIEALTVLRKATCDVAIAFGTGWIRDDALQLLPHERWNLHGGDPQKYRGLDSHLWALYHNDHGAVITTVHTLARELDSGEIIAGSRIDVASAPELHMLRAASTDLAVRLTIGGLAYLEAIGNVARMPQVTAGRYYSALPSTLWDRCARNYALLVKSRSGRA